MDIDQVKPAPKSRSVLLRSSIRRGRGATSPHRGRYDHPRLRLCGAGDGAGLARPTRRRLVCHMRTGNLDFPMYQAQATTTVRRGEQARKLETYGVNRT